MSSVKRHRWNQVRFLVWLIACVVSVASLTATGANDTPTQSVYLALLRKRRTPPATPTPLPTSAPTRTPTSPPAATLTPTPIPTPAPATYFAIGPGFTDDIPHQIVRANDDRLYVFCGQPQGSSPTITVRAYWTTAPGLPNTTADFAGSTEVVESELPIAVDPAYDGGNIFHVIVNTQAGNLKDYIFDKTTHTFRSVKLLATGSPTVPGSFYIGTMGISSRVDTTGKLHIAYRSSGNHITHRAYTYNTTADTLTLVEGPTQVDTDGSANHPALAVSPADNAIEVAWVSEVFQSTNDVRVLARTRASSGTWGTVERVNTAPVWTSTNAGINIDQGPNILITADGTRHLVYIENWDSTNSYGHIHYVINRNDGAGWIDQAISVYTHAPALASNSRGEMYIIGHGHPNNTSCTSENTMCTIKKNSDGTWGTPQLFATPPGSDRFDSSPSVKWSVVGYNRPETIEFVFFDAIGGDYSNTAVYYGRLP